MGDQTANTSSMSIPLPWGAPLPARLAILATVTVSHERPTRCSAFIKALIATERWSLIAFDE